MARSAFRSMLASARQRSIRVVCVAVTAVIVAGLVPPPLIAASDPCPVPSARAADGTPRLAGHVYDIAAGACRTDAEAWIAVRAKDLLLRRGILLLGEVHDNAAHHAARGRLIERLAADKAVRQTAPTLVFEHVRADKGDALRQAIGEPPHGRASAADLFQALAWADSGWPDADLFTPLFGAALAARFPMRAGDAARGDVRRVAREGIAALPADVRSRFRLDAPMPAAVGDDLLAELEASHCGLMPRNAFAGMALAQRYRDAALASAADATDGGAIVFAGNGHVRADRGVPYALRAAGIGRPVFVVMYLEVDARHADAAAHVPRGADGSTVADLVVFTARADREDPCIAMRRSFSPRPRPGG